MDKIPCIIVYTIGYIVIVISCSIVNIVVHHNKNLLFLNKFVTGLQAPYSVVFVMVT